MRAFQSIYVWKFREDRKPLRALTTKNGKQKINWVDIHDTRISIFCPAVIFVNIFDFDC